MRMKTFTSLITLLLALCLAAPAAGPGFFT